ncbi:hypothetical protein C8R47DRAFT_1283414 [Mycena vitilis]|nr:hypothetical protein C8R47DRAFT_1283414 [Mycena vitilis]
MSFTLPVNALFNMQISLKVELPNGKVAYSIAPSSFTTVTASVPSIRSENGMQLHINATSEESGILLSLFMTGGQVAQEPLPVLRSTSLDSTLASIPSPAATDSLFCGGGFPATERVDPNFNFHETMGLDPLLDSFDNTPANCGTADFVFDALNPAYNINDLDFREFGINKEDGVDYATTSSSHLGCSDDASSSFPVTTSPLILPAMSSEDTDVSLRAYSTEPSPTQDSPPTSPTTVGSSTAPNWSSRRSSLAHRSPGTSAGLRCLDPRCDRYLASKYLLTKHMKTHEPRSDQSFRCTMGCALEFSRKHDRLRHEVVQHKKLCDWECNECFGFFSSQTTLQKHKCRPRARG